MHNRLRLLRAATALLYLGPLLAGLMGQGWDQVAVFAVIYLLRSVILRPQLWPARLADLSRSEALVPLASVVATQVLLVVVCFAIGRGIGGVLGVKPGLPWFLPVALAFLSVPLSRLIWDSEVAADLAVDCPALGQVQRAATAVGEAAAAMALTRLAAVLRRGTAAVRRNVVRSDDVAFSWNGQCLWPMSAGVSHPRTPVGYLGQSDAKF